MDDSGWYQCIGWSPSVVRDTLNTTTFWQDHAIYGAYSPRAWSNSHWNQWKVSHWLQLVLNQVPTPPGYTLLCSCSSSLPYPRLWLLGDIVWSHGITFPLLPPAIYRPFWQNKCGVYVKVLHQCLMKEYVLYSIVLLESYAQTVLSSISPLLYVHTWRWYLSV